MLGAENYLKSHSIVVVPLNIFQYQVADFAVINSPSFDNVYGIDVKKHASL